ncbi:FG-GAP repeat protein [Ponticoccus gilvus]|nr:FG-GAP repeat protein [Enemella evansiae]
MLPDLKIGELNGRNGVLLRGSQLEDRFGRSVSSGDFNGDGLGDILVGAVGTNPTGAGYLFYGPNDGFPAVIDLNGNASFYGIKLTSGTEARAIAWESTFIGDVNGDGFDDILVSGFPLDSEIRFAGRAFVVFGSDSAPFEIDVDMLDGTNGFTLATEILGGRFGSRPAKLGDINGDGVDDFSVSRQNEDFIFFGSQSGRPASIDVDTLAPEDGVKIDASLASNWIKPVGDLDGDGIGDFMLSAQLTEVEGVEDAGVVYVIYSQPETFPRVITEENIGSVDGFAIRGTLQGQKLGRSLGDAGDFNGDGFLDIAVGYFDNPQILDPGDSAIQIIFGDGNRISTDIDLPSASGGLGLLIEGLESSINRIESSGDVNGDGLDDLIIGAFETKTLGVASGGAVYVVYGTTDTSTISVDDLDGTNGYTLSGANLWGFELGWTVSAGGDLNGDGYDDIVVGQRYEYESFMPSPGTSPQIGEAFVIYGAETGFHYDTVSGSGVFAGTTNQELITGSAGNDWILTLGGSDLVDGQGGKDMVSFVWSDGQIGVFQTEDEIEVFPPDYAELLLRNVEGVTGTGGDDLFQVSDGRFRTLGGDDTIIVTGQGTASYDGGAGQDVLSYAASTTGISASLLKGRGWGGDAAGDSYIAIERLIGSNSDDFLWGDHAANRLEGGLGDDTLVGNGGDDYILAGFGTDVIVYAGNRSDYTIIQDGIRTEVISGGWEGHDVIGHAEVLRFADGDVIL